MKKIFIAVLALFAITVINAATQFEATAGTNIEWQPYNEITVKGAAIDTLAGVDSTTLFTLETFQPGWTYFIKSGLMTGTGSDSVVMHYAVDYYNTSKTRIGRYFTSDTVKTANGNTIELPIMRKGLAAYYTIKAMTLTGTGGQLILNHSIIDRARYITINK